MQIFEVDIDKIKPDKDQPRTYIDEEDLKEMAQSIVTTGIINPIEVDKSFTIVTGERRWRAAAIAGLKKVPVRVIDLNDDDRFTRQVIENIHHNTMSDWDTANALKKMLNLWPGPKERLVGPKDSAPGKSLGPTKGPTVEKGLAWLSRKVGRSPKYILDKLDIIDSSENFKEAVRSNKISGSFTRTIRQSPIVHKKAVEKKILDGEFKTRDGSLQLVAALRREESNPQIVQKLLDTDYSKFKTEAQVVNAITKISPPLSELIDRSYDPAREISRISDELQDWLDRNPKSTIGKIHEPRIIINVTVIRNAAHEWLRESKLLN